MVNRALSLPLLLLTALAGCRGFGKLPRAPYGVEAFSSVLSVMLPPPD